MNYSKVLFVQDDSNRKISKATYLLLEKYHRLYGLEIYLFSSGHGAGYVGFQVAANPCCTKQHIYANYFLQHTQGGRYGPLVTYLCGSVGVPSWASRTGQLEMPDWEQKRTSAILAWLEQHLAFENLFRQNEDAIARWRQHYSVEQSEQYLLMVNLAGLLAMRTGGMPRAPGQCESVQDPDAAARVKRQLALLGLDTQNGTVMGIKGVQVARNGKALVGEQVIDIWQRRVEGQTPEQLADWLLALRVDYNVT